MDMDVSCVLKSFIRITVGREVGFHHPTFLKRDTDTKDCVCMFGVLLYHVMTFRICSRIEEKI